MTQTKRHSAIEATANIAAGYLIALATQLVVFPLFGLSVSLSENIQIGLIFTAVSWGRSYLIRRFFNYRGK